MRYVIFWYDAYEPSESGWCWASMDEDTNRSVDSGFHVSATWSAKDADPAALTNDLRSLLGLPKDVSIQVVDEFREEQLSKAKKVRKKKPK